jgi:hypothetical protein
MNIYSWLKEHAENRPDKTAVRYRDIAPCRMPISFPWTARLEHSPADAGVGRGDHVTIVLPNTTPEFVISYMAIVGIRGGGGAGEPVHSHPGSSRMSLGFGSKALIMETNNLSTYTEHPWPAFPGHRHLNRRGGGFFSVDEREDKGIIEDMDPG